MPLADEVIFSLWPGVAADGLRALGGLAVVMNNCRARAAASSVGRRWEEQRGGARWAARAAAQDAREDRGGAAGNNDGRRESRAAEGE